MSSRFGTPPPVSQGESYRRKIRRLLSRSDEEIEDEMDDRGLSYRYGWPQLPSLPVQTSSEDARMSVPNAVEHLEQVRNILDHQRIHHKHAYFAFRVPRDADSESNYLTLVVLIDTSRPNMFRRGVMDIRRYFRKNDATSAIIIELLDYRATRGLITLPVNHTHEAILRAYDEVREIIIAEITNANARWLSIELVHRGLVSDACSPTLVITTPTASESSWWRSVLPAIRTRLADVVPVFDVEVMCGLTLFASPSASTVSSHSYEKNTTMGVSIGLPGDPKHVGTLGGYVRLHNRPATTYGLTNYHVVRDGRIDQVIGAAGEGYLRPGNPVLTSQPHFFDSPADVDHAQYIALLAESKLAYKSWEGKETEDPTGAVAKETAKIEQTETHVLQHNRTKYCKLIAASGARAVTSTLSRDPVLLDWALVEIAAERIATNILPNAAPVPRTPQTVLTPGLPCTRWSPLDTGETNIKRYEVNVCKYGRTTGWTFGQICVPDVKINTKERDFREMAKAYGIPEGGNGSCFAVVERPGFPRAVVEPGDSGSIVLHDKSRSWLGLLFGQTGAGSALMVPMSLVLRDIEHVTGSSVTEPRMTIV
ncbi:hypothetical protein J1614_009057 [Plenodomus biglobosus]|nr:hypothetical protein J1614_009057 [Plenodomus biglobosus]